MILTAQYWKKAFAQLKNIKIMCLCAIFVALQVLSTGAYIQIAENLRIMFNFFFVAIASCIGGPIMALINGFVADIVSFMLFPSGSFFFGYTLSTMLSSFVFALFLWDTKISILKIALSRAIVNIFINILLGSVWTVMLLNSDKGYVYFVIKSAMKNLALLPLEIILLSLMFKTLIPFLYRKHLCKSNKFPLI